MQNFTEHGQGVINDLSSRYGISTDAIIHMLFSVSNGGGTMAQFNCPELGGGGQWMQGGMTMVGDMFNHGLKATVDNLCFELSGILANQGASLFVPVKKQPVNQGGQHQQQGNMGQNSLFVAGGGRGNWWPDDQELGMASSTGGQNNIRYAVFPQTHRLAVEINGRVTVYDTLDHQIGGVSQQQGGDASMTFTSQFGLVQVSQLPVVSIDGDRLQPIEQPPAPPQEIQQVVQQHEQAVAPSFIPTDDDASHFEDDIFNKIERLAALKEKGILSDEEFSAKKAELLQRL